MNDTQDWAEALDTQLRLYEWWNSDDGRKYGRGFGESLLESTVRAQAKTDEEAVEAMHHLIQNNAFAALKIAEHEADLLGQADTYFVSEEMAAFAAWAGESLPDGMNMRPSLLPGPRGFVRVEGGIPLKDRRGDTFIVKGIAWSTDATSDDWEADNVRGVDYTLYSDPLDERESDPYAREIRAEHGNVNRDRKMPVLWLFHASAVKYGPIEWSAHRIIANAGEDIVVPGDARYDDDTGGEHFVAAVEDMLAMERWLVSFWMLVDQPIVDVDLHWPKRALRRRFQHAVPHPPDEATVRVVTLRRSAKPEKPTTDGEPEARQWSHRWWVRPHWRRIHQGTPDERLVLVSGHQKGPEDAPLILRDTVFVWRR